MRGQAFRVPSTEDAAGARLQVAGQVHRDGHDRRAGDVERRRAEAGALAVGGRPLERDLVAGAERDSADDRADRRTLADVDAAGAAESGRAGDGVGGGVERDAVADLEADAGAAEIWVGGPDSTGSVEQPTIHVPAESPPARSALRMVIFVFFFVMMTFLFSECSECARGDRRSSAGVGPSERTVRSAATHDGDSWAPVVRAFVTARCRARERRFEIGEARSKVVQAQPIGSKIGEAQRPLSMRRCLIRAAQLRHSMILSAAKPGPGSPVSLTTSKGRTTS